MHAIVAALDGSDLELVVALSTYGAQPGEHLGDLGVLYEFEQSLLRQSAPVAIVRCAYFMSNWEWQVATVRDTGVLSSFFPSSFSLPMVAPSDIGRYVAALLMGEAVRSGPHYVEAAHYSPVDVASAFSDAMGRPVQVHVIRPDEWAAAFRDIGFSAAAAASYSAMTAATIEACFPAPERVQQMPTTLRVYIAALVAKDA